jgi:hypothetical protein
MIRLYREEIVRKAHYLPPGRDPSIHTSWKVRKEEEEVRKEEKERRQKAKRESQFLKSSGRTISRG